MRITTAEVFGLVSLMLATMGNAAIEGCMVHGAEVWYSFRYSPLCLTDTSVCTWACEQTLSIPVPSGQKNGEGIEPNVFIF